MAFEKRKKKLYYRSFSSILVVLTTTALGRMTVKYVKKKKNGCEGDKKKKGPLPDLVLGVGYSHIWAARPIYLPKFMKT